MAANDIGFNISVTGVEASKKKVKDFQQTTTRELTTAENSVARSVGNMVKQYASIAIGIRTAQKALSSGIEFNKFIETQTAAFTVMMKSADKAKAQIKDLYDFAIKSPLKFTDTVSASKQLLAYGFAAEELVPTMNRLGTVALATGNSLAEVNYVYGTLRAQGRAYSRDLMQFGTRGIPIYEELAKVLGVDVKMVQKLTSEGKVGFKEVEQAFINMSNEGGRFGGFIDEYMKNFEGKANKLSDIWAQSMGTLTSSLFDVMKTGLDSIISTLESSGMQTIFKNIGEDLGGVANALSKVMEVMIKLIPTLTTFLKLWVAFKALNLLTSVLKGIPAMLNKMAEGLFAVTGAMTGGLTTSIAAFGTTASSAFGNAVASVQLFGGALKALMMSNPWLAALLIAGTALTTIMFIYKHQDDKARESAFSSVRKGQLEKDMAPVAPLPQAVTATNGRPYAARPPTQAAIEATYYKKTIQDVQQIAKEYNLTEDSVADSLIKIKALSEQVWDKHMSKIHGRNMAHEWNAELRDSISKLNFADTFEAVGISMDEYIQDALFVDNKSALYSKYIEDYIDANIMSKEEAEKYRKEMQEISKSVSIEPDLQYKKFKITENLPKVDKGIIDQMILAGANDDQISALTEGTIKDRIKTLSAYIENLTARDAKARAEGTINKATGEIDQNTGLLRWLLEQLRLAEDSLGKSTQEKAKEIKDLGAWWLPQEASAGASISALDDIQLVADKALASAKDQIAARIKLAQENIDSAIYNNSITKDTKIQAINNALILKYQQEIADIEAKRLGIERDITTETERQKGVTKFTEMKEGQAGYWDEMANKASGANTENFKKLFTPEGNGAENFKDFGKSALATGATAIQGTEVGNMMAGADPVTGLILALAEMLMSIENVNKVLNPFSTIMEGMKSVIEPFVNSALLPLVHILEMLGATVGRILAPFLSIIQVLTSILYPVLLLLISPLTELGNFFASFNDNILVPAGDAIIDVINGVIKALNQIPFVSIKYLDSMNKVEKGLVSLADTLGYMQDNLKTTMDYFANKLKSITDKELTSLQDLYEVGAISGAEYERGVAEANLKSIDSSKFGVSDKDLAITDAVKMMERYLKLAQGDMDISRLDKDSASFNEDLENILSDLGISSKSKQENLVSAIEKALKNYGVFQNEEGFKKVRDAEMQNKPEIGKGDPYYMVPIEFKAYDKLQAEGASLVKQLKEEKDKKWYNQNIFKQTQLETQISLKIAETMLTTGKLASFSAGTAQVPYDMRANIHKDEGIIPATFMNSIRSGDLVLSGNKKEGSGQNVIVNVTVQGSVTSERDLANTIATQIYTNRSRGLLTV